MATNYSSRFPWTERRKDGTYRVWWGPDEPAFDDFDTAEQAAEAVREFDAYVADQVEVEHRQEDSLEHPARRY